MSNASGDDELDKQHFRELVEDVRDALNVTCDAKALHSLTCLESLFGRISGERDRLIEERRLDAGWMYAHELEGENASLQVELGRIREAALTPEEALSIVSSADAFPRFRNAILPDVLAKLRFISGGALKEGATQ